jgi:hypothetical protein
MRDALAIAAFESRWYLCELGDTSIGVEEPDWSRVPEPKRETVRARWLAANAQRRVERVHLWGPQIPFFARQPYYDVRVVDVQPQSEP